MSRSHLPATLCGLALLTVAGAFTFGAAAGELVERSERSAGGRRVDIAIDPATEVADWRSFTILTEPPARSEGLAARELDDSLRTAIAVAFGVGGFQHRQDGAVDFVVEYRFAHPGDPPPGTTSWANGRQVNWLEITLRAPDVLNIAWRGRVFSVLRKKRNQRQQDSEAELRFHAAAEAIVDAFRTSRGETF